MSKDLKSETPGDEVVDGAASSIENLSITELDIPAAYAKYRHLAGLDSWEVNFDPYARLPDFQPTPHQGEWPPPNSKPTVGGVREECDICGGNHSDLGCSYRERIPANITTRPPKLDLSRFGVYCCRCCDNIVDGGVRCKSCPPGTTSMVANHPSEITYGPPRYERPCRLSRVYIPTPVLGGGSGDK